MFNREDCADDASISLYFRMAVCFFFSLCTMFCFKEGCMAYMVCLGIARLSFVFHFAVQAWRDDEFVCDKSTYLFSFSTIVVYFLAA